MLAKINQIKGLGLVFADFTWPANLAPFKAVNLIYGWNGSGKTTLTRLFDAAASTEPTDVEYELMFSGDVLVANGAAVPHAIRVFNSDYVQRNVRISESSANTISVLLGEENRDLVAQIEADERSLNGDSADAEKIGLIAEFRNFTQKRARKIKENETAFSDIAKAIGAAIIGSGSASRTYRSPEAKRDFAQISNPVGLSKGDLQQHVLSLRQEPLSEVPPIPRPLFEAGGRVEDAEIVVERCMAQGRKLSALTVESELIARLASHPDIAEWVEAGTKLHSLHDSEDCEYCGGPLSAARVSQLARHFNDADRQLKEDLETAVVDLRAAYAAIDSLVIPDPARLYQELQPAFSEGAVRLKAAKADLLLKVAAVGKALQEKKLKTTQVMPFEFEIPFAAFNEELLSANSLTDAHNRKSKDFTRIQRAAISAIKSHYLSTIHAGVSARVAEIETLNADLDKRSDEIAKLQQRTQEARAQISSAHKACEQLNEGLHTFLGRRELTFEPDVVATEQGEGKTVETTVGYRILRGKAPAERLSEGEKTAIAFVYFVVHLNDGQFDKATGMVVVDDPISSLDSNSQYQAFSFLKNAVKDGLQVFILTHNFEFLKLLVNWRNRDRNTAYFMISNHFVGNDRRANLTAMDKELREYQTEYHYLFKRLREMNDEQEGSLMRAYPVPNIARKVWESFMLFAVPNSRTPYGKMEVFKSAGYDAQKLDAIYKFTNDQSHMTGGGFDPALVPETKKVLAQIFEMMETIAPEHYRILSEATNPGGH